MLADWSIECSAEDPVLVVPWESLEGGCGFVDLRANPYDLELIPEAERHPPMLQALRALNAPRSPVFSAKSDVWELDAAELGQLRLELEVAEDEAPVGWASYIDLLFRDRAFFLSLPQQEQALRRLTRKAEALESKWAMLDCVLRPALLDLETPWEGFAISLYVKALGGDAAAALERWAAALEAVVSLIRKSELAL